MRIPLLTRPHYVDWDFNSKITSHFQFLQKPFILDVCKPLNFFFKFSMWDLGDICINPFWIAWTGPDKSEIFSGINFLSIWSFIPHPCFPPKRSQKWHFSSFSSKIANALFRGYFSAKRGKMTLLRPFQWENMDDV